MPVITLPDGSQRSFEQPVTVAGVAANIGAGLAKAALAGRVDGKALMAEVVQKTIDDQSKQVLAERKLKPAYQPEVKLPEDRAEVEAIMDGKGDLAFSVSLEIIPEFEAL